MLLEDVIYLVIEHATDITPEGLDIDRSNVYLNRKELIDDVQYWPYPKQFIHKRGLLPEPWISVLLYSPKFDYILIAPTEVQVDRKTIEYQLRIAWEEMTVAPTEILGQT